MRAGLRAIIKMNKDVKGGKGGLTKTKIQSLSNHYWRAMMDYTTTSKDSAKIEQAMKKVKKRILGNLYHSVFMKTLVYSTSIVNTLGAHTRNI